MPLLQVGHPSGEELDVRAADAGPVHVDDDLARTRRRRLDIKHGRLSRPGHDKSPHQCLLSTD
jgi:hypothetical protein